jgi:hypothetical protein
VVNLSEELKRRANDVISNITRITGSEAAQFATTLLTNLYGPQSPQLEQFRAGREAIARTATNPSYMDDYFKEHALGTIQNAVAEMNAGLIVNIRAAVAGEVLSELSRLAKEILADQTEAAKNVSAVLVAASYEDLIRRMGEEFAGVAGRPDLQDVLIALKDKGVLKGGEVGTAQSYLKFRNDSLHADWNNISRPQIESCLAFVESLLLKYFSG